MAYDEVKRAESRTEFIKSLDELDREGKPKFDKDQKERQIELFDATSKALEENATRSGKGLRVHTGMTRGKGSMVVKWEAFDDSVAESLPVNVQEFLDITKATEGDLLDYLIVGYNDAQYTAASDPIAEYVNPLWDKDTQTQFRLVVRNASKAMNKSIEEVATMFKPGVEAAFAAKQKS